MATPGWTEKKRSSAPMRRGGDPQKIYWEGINLNKISKKIVSAVTMGAFAVTLIPAAAFGAPLESAGDKYADVDLVSSATTYNDTVTLKVKLDATDFDHNNDLVGIWIDANNDGVADANAITDVTTSLDTKTVSVFPNARTGGAPWGDAWFSDGLKNVTGDEFTVTVELAVDGAQDLKVGVYDQSAATAGSNDSLNTLSANTAFDITVATTDAVADGSRLLIDGKIGPAEATQGEAKTFSFNVVDADGLDTTLPYADNTYVWVENSSDVVVKDALFGKADGSDLTVDNLGNGIYQVIGQVNNKDTLNVTFPDAGDGYSIHAVVDTTAPTPDAYGKVAEKAYTVIDPITVNVTKAAVNTSIIEVTSVDGQTVTPDADLDYYTVRIDDEVTPSNTKEYTVTGYAWVAKDTDPAEEVEVTITPEDAGMTIVGDTTVKTDNTGKFTFKYKVDDAASYIVKLVAGDATSYLKVTHGDVDAVHIEKIADGGKVLAGTDKDYASQVYDADGALFSDAIQIGITDAYGRDAVGEGVLADEAAANVDRAGLDHSDAVTVEKWAEGSDVDADDFFLAWDEDAGIYTLKYTGDAKDLTAGDYAVRIALNNGGDNAITVNFTAVEFGEVQDIVLDMVARPVNSWDSDANNENSIKVIDDQVALGQHVAVTPKYVDENGLKVEIENYRNLNVGINGDAVAHNGMIWFETQDNIGANNSLIGSTITVKINDLNTNKYVEKELTVVKNYLNETVSIDPTQGVVGEANTVTVSVVDEDGNVSKVNGKLSATIVGQSDEEATVDLKVNPQVKNGTARMYLESDKAGTVDVRVVVTANNGELYADTFTYTFGDEDPYAGTTVVMVIGSDQYLINNEVLDGSVDNLGAPYVDSAWRTMVPVRVLAESFGADVDFDEEAQTVTIVDGDTTIVMTVGSTEYTINGEAAEAMDTAPVIGSDNRTYVPVRFVAEGLGYEVSPLYNAENGTTSSVVFQK